MLTISHDGYTVTQADNNHISIFKDGTRVIHASSAVRYTKETLVDAAKQLLRVAQHMPKPPAPAYTPHYAPWPSAKEVEQIKRDYPIGTRIKLEHMNDSMHPVPDGVRGSVRFIDDAGQLHMDWDNGRSLAVIPNVDSFRKLTAGEAQLEEELEIFCVEMMQDLTQSGDYQSFHISDKDEYLTIKLNKSFDGDRLFFHVSFTPEGGDTANHEKHTEIAEHHADHLLKACRKVLSMYGK